MCIVMCARQQLLVYQAEHTGQTAPFFAYLCVLGQEREHRFKNGGWRAHHVFSSEASAIIYAAREHQSEFVPALVRF